MRLDFYGASERGSGDYGWLKPNYYFSFGQHYNPKRMHFGALRVLNDDYIAGGGAFPPHPHDNMEIITIPFTGALAHRDSTGGVGLIEAGDVQIMSAGKGIMHAEANASATDPVTLFQIWVFPKEKQIEPRYDQRRFDPADRKNKWQVVVSPLEQDQALWINQDARFSLADIDAQQTLSYTPAFAGNGLFLVVIQGEIVIGDQVLVNRDAAGISEFSSVSIQANQSSAVLAIEVPMTFN